MTLNKELYQNIADLLTQEEFIPYSEDSEVLIRKNAYGYDLIRNIFINPNNQVHCYMVSYVSRIDDILRHFTPKSKFKLSTIYCPNNLAQELTYENNLKEVSASLIETIRLKIIENEKLSNIDSIDSKMNNQMDTINLDPYNGFGIDGKFRKLIVAHLNQNKNYPEILEWVQTSIYYELKKYANKDVVFNDFIQNKYIEKLGILDYCLTHNYFPIDAS